MKSNLLRQGFLGLVVTQFFGAANDNILKQVLSFGVAAGGVWAGTLGDGGQAYVGLCLAGPFIVFSGIAGRIADRFSKRNITVIVKLAEVLIALVGLAAFWMGDVWLALAAMLLLATQSAFFGPAKYGMIPELVEVGDLSRANGTINMFTNIAVIIGTLAAGPLYAAFYPPSNPDAPPDAVALMWIPGVALLVVAVLGLGASLLLPRLAARDPDLAITAEPFGTYLQAIREMSASPLLLVALAWGFFYMVGMIALLILPDYKALLAISPTEASYLLGVLGVAIGAGSVLAGIVSGHHIEPRLVPVGAVGMIVFFTALGLAPLVYWLIAVLLFCAGIFAGLYIVPLQALLQKLSPEDERGRFLGTANAISFCFIALGSLTFLAARRTLGLDANRIFLVCAVLAVIGTGFLLWRLRRLIGDPAIRS